MKSDSDSEPEFEDLEFSDAEFKPKISDEINKLDEVINELRTRITAARSNINKLRKDKLKKCINKLVRAKTCSPEDKTRLLCEAYMSINKNLFVDVRLEKKRIRPRSKIVWQKRKEKAVDNRNFLVDLYIFSIYL
ncbi:MAG: hypothetical protein LBE09_04905, partial [Christensenellaceae bacterium]|nr:hypothetical protein [Christensenellaceae bacterium]